MEYFSALDFILTFPSLLCLSFVSQQLLLSFFGQLWLLEAKEDQMVFCDAWMASEKSRGWIGQLWMVSMNHLPPSAADQPRAISLRPTCARRGTKSIVVDFHPTYWSPLCTNHLMRVYSQFELIGYDTASTSNLSQWLSGVLWEFLPSPCPRNTWICNNIH